MITIHTVCETLPGLSETTLRSWLEQEWVQADLRSGEPVFDDIDVSRIRLILELRTRLEVEEPTVPLILSLLDQLYATRQRLRVVLAAMESK